MDVALTAEEKAVVAGADMTNEEAQCYLNRYPDVVQKVGLGNTDKAKLHWKNHGEKESRVKTCDPGLTDAEAQCYIARYPDLAAYVSEAKPLEVAKKHYQDWGIYEGRQKFCAPRITDQEAQCYIDRYPDLQGAFGDSNHAWINAKKHW